MGILDCDGCADLRKQLSESDKALESLRDLIKVQSQDGNWNYDPYMMGMANGMILVEHTIARKEGMPKYFDAPAKWIKDSSSPSSTKEEPKA